MAAVDEGEDMTQDDVGTRAAGAGAAALSPTTSTVIAGDIGGTSSRVLLARPDGTILAEHTGPGANLRSSGLAALDGLARTIGELLERAAADPAAVRAVALGLSGAGPARVRDIRDAIAERLLPLGITTTNLLVTDDLLTAFLSGGVGDTGLLVLAGTGAVAVRVEDRRPVRRRDGMGWLLGDIGSAVWLGRRTLEVVAADLDDRGPRTSLTEQVGADLGLDLRDGTQPPSPTGDLRQDLIRALDDAVPAGSPSALGRFAPLPARVPDDPVAAGILDAAARTVEDTLAALDLDGTLPVVLAGSVLTSDGPLRERALALIAGQGRRVGTARDGLPGALLLARDLAAGQSA
ncbi:N-acetylglucosamine kinase [Brachybacterium sp. UMB0905]|uniref:N-acetylglucosamine kinase n=1 Tax=Brachybacterium sp. UMB0905 TaxID=2069310 RepID=UPI001E3E9D77|nr:BadF/BadG/BcrA/BcrD ATPase family protein [Brachybacterium sp. UMB0905]